MKTATKKPADQVDGRRGEQQDAPVTVPDFLAAKARACG